MASILFPSVRSAILPLVLFASVFACAQEGAGRRNEKKEEHKERVHPFTVYAFIPWHARMKDGHLVAEHHLADYLKTQGIQPIKVIYKNGYFTDDKPDPVKIGAIAKATQQEPDVPVSFDTEFGDRFHPSSMMPRVLEILRLYREAGGKAKVGVYATAPQETFGWTPETKGKYDPLNRKYAPVAAAVDFHSPVLYTYGDISQEKWAKYAAYGVEAAQAYGTGKPIIPYITLVHPKTPKGDWLDAEPMSEERMAHQLRTLYDLGASGCIIWASSEYKGGDEVMHFDPEKGWGKAVVEFIREHREAERREQAPKRD